jgi:hypothetical protein
MKTTVKAMMICTALVTAMGLTKAEAYNYQFVNATTEPVKVDFCGVGVIGCKMMQDAWGLIGTTEYIKEGNKLIVKNAGKRFGPIEIPAGEIVELRFTAADFGICLDNKTVEVGLKSQNFTMENREVYKGSNTAQQRISAASSILGSIGGIAGGIGDGAAASAGVMTGGAISAAASQALGGLAQGIGSLFTEMSCENNKYTIYEIPATLPNADGSPGATLQLDKHGNPIKDVVVFVKT